MNRSFLTIYFLIAAFSLSCATADRLADASPAAQLPPPTVTPTPEPTPTAPDLRVEFTDVEYSRSASPIGSFDFLNFTYELPRGWQNPDGSSSLTLEDGKTEPVGVDSNDGMSADERAVSKFERRIGLTHVATKFFDVTGDGEDEAIVILQIETGGSATPHIVYVFTWENEKPSLIWPFRTGDRADGGLKRIWPENGMLAVELYGMDRFILGQTETNKITGDREQLCCPTHFTRTQYKWNGKNFLMQGKRLTYSVSEPTELPLENHGETMNDPAKAKKFLEGQR